MAKIIIDGKVHEVEEGKNLLEVCLSLGYDLPYFCWHPAMGSVGACRQCAIKKFKDEEDEQGKLFMACMEPVADGDRISITDKEAVDFRSNTIEWMMANHPHDCAVCDEGGECHLQDMTVMTGHNYRNYRFNKRTYQNQYLGPLVNHEMNRCIQCYRCVRFYKDYAGGKDLDVFAAHDHVYFGRAKDGVLENEFSGNLVEVCPTGVFTDKTLKNHYTRKWDLRTAPSICSHCSVGCNTIVGERYGSIRRVLSRYNGEVNGYFLCDRGRFGYEYNNDESRIRKTLLREGQKERTLTIEEGIIQARQYIADSSRVVGVGSPRASLEANYALKNLVGEENFYAGVDKKQHDMTRQIAGVLSDLPLKTPGLQEMGACDAVVVLGEDLTNTAPMMALALRQSVRNQPKEKAKDAQIPLWQDDAVREIAQGEKGPLFIAAPYATKLEEVSTDNYHASPKEIARFAFAIAHILDEEVEKVELPEELQKLAEQIAKSLKEAKKPLIVSGSSCTEPVLIEAAANLAQASYKNNDQTRISYVVPEANSMGLAMLEEKSLDSLTEQGADIDTFLLLENDLFIRKNAKSIDGFLKKAQNIIVLDHLKNQTTNQADLLIPVGTTAESTGTFINQEGRAQRFFQVHKPEGDMVDSWKWLALMAEKRENIKLSDIDYDSLLEGLMATHPQFEALKKLAPSSDYRIAGQKVARETHRYSGRTAMNADKDVNEPKPDEDKNSPLSFTMEGYHGRPPSALNPNYWSPGWNSAQAINKYQIEVGGPLHDGDPGIRLLEPKKDAELQYFKNVPKLSELGEGKMLAIPRYHIFGSDELSQKSPAIAELSPEAYIGISSEDAKRLDVDEEDFLQLEFAGTTHRHKAKIIEGLSAGLLALPYGMNTFYDFSEPEVINLKKNSK